MFPMITTPVEWSVLTAFLASCIVDILPVESEAVRLCQVTYLIIKVRPPMGGVSYSDAGAGCLPDSQ